METSFSNISGMFKVNTEIINRALAGVKPEDWFRKPGDDSNHLMISVGTSNFFKSSVKSVSEKALMQS